MTYTSSAEYAVAAAVVVAVVGWNQMVRGAVAAAVGQDGRGR